MEFSLACPDSRTEFDLGAAPTDADGRLYRVYRTTDEGAWQPIGSTLVAGWVDPTAESNVVYRYAVAAYTESGAESALSETVQVVVSDPPIRQLYLPVVMNR